MSLKYGLNVKKAAPAPARKALLDDEEEDEETQNDANAAEDITSFGRSGTTKAASLKSATDPSTRPPPARRKGEEEDRQDLSSAQASRAQVQAAESLDPTIFDYDSFHDAKTSITDAKKAAARQDAIDRKPKYINNLLDAAARRKQDQQVAREKFLQKEREAEGDEFADKEKFVTGAYKEQQAETRRLEEGEKRKGEEEERRRREGGGGMQGFYRGMIDQREQQHQEAMEAAQKLEQDGGVKTEPSGKMEKSEAELAAELRAKGINIHTNDEGQITDKRELLSAGLNIGGSSGKSKDSPGGGADHLKSSSRSSQSAFAGRSNANRDAQRERQSKMMEEQLAARAKRAREEEDEERQKAETAAKSTKTAADVSDAKARYLARKAAKERGEG